MTKKPQTVDEYLAHTARIVPKHLPHYLRWVEKFQQSGAASHPDRGHTLEELRSRLEKRYEP